MTPSAAVVVEDVRKRYDGREVLAGVSFEVRPGELFALLGPNGAGKTTTVEMIEGYRQADGGTVRVLGLDPGGDSRRLRARIGIMLQDGGVDPRTTPEEALDLYGRFYQRPADADRLLDLVGLQKVRRARYRRLSVGERQRLGLALALVGRPELLVLDEPTAGMDPAARATTRDLLGALKATGTTMLLTTHDLVDVERLADRVALIDRGRIVALGSPAELTAGAPSRVRFRLARPLDDSDRRSLETQLRVSVAAAGSAGRYTLDGRAPTPDLFVALTSFLASRGAVLVELDAGGATLEERYLELVGRAAATEPERTPTMRA